MVRLAGPRHWALRGARYTLRTREDHAVMGKTRKTAATPDKTPATPLGIENQLWAAANTLRGSVDAAEYKHVVLGLVFLKYISDAFEAQHARLEGEVGQGADPEDPDE